VPELAVGDEVLGYRVIEVFPKGLDIVADVAVLISTGSRITARVHT
jgi:hypothetical protein